MNITIEITKMYSSKQYLFVGCSYCFFERWRGLALIGIGGLAWTVEHMFSVADTILG